MSEKNTKYIVYRENWKQSLVCDLQTLFVFSIGFVLNEWYVQSEALSILLVVCIVIWIMHIAGDKRKIFYNIDDVLKYLQDEENDK